MKKSSSRPSRSAEGRVSSNTLWLCYYVVTVLLNLAAVIVFWSHIRITFASLVPGVLMLLPLLMSLIDSPDQRRRRNRRAMNAIKYNPDESMADSIADGILIDGAKDDVEYSIWFMFFMVPLMLPFVLFFGDGVKMGASAGFLLGGCVLVIAVTAVLSFSAARRESREQKAKEEAALREQRAREEEGRFR